MNIIIIFNTQITITKKTTMSHKNSQSITKKTLASNTLLSYQSIKLKKILSLNISIAFSLATLSVPTYAEEYRESKAVDATAPIAALSKLSSLDNVKPLQVTVPNIEHFKTEAGIPVSFVRTTTLPIVDIDLRFNAGSARDDSVRAQGFGIANMTATMLTQGTNNLDENEFTRAVETLGINLNSSAYKDMFIVSLRSLSDDEHLVPALELMTQMLNESTFDKQVLSRNKARLLVGLQQQKQDPNSLASLAFDKALYGTHPYAHPSSGTLDSVPNIEQKDLIDFQNRYLVAANASLSMTGNLTLDQAKRIAESVTSNLSKGKVAAILPEPKPLTKAQYIHIPFPSSQTTVLMGQLGEKRATDAKAQQQQTNFAIGNDVLAGSDFNARLMTEIRQNLGYTYGISGGMSPMLARGPYQISFAVRNEKAQAAIDASLSVINETLDKGITADELQLTTDNLKNSFPMGFASNAGINGLLGMMNFYQLPDSYLTSYIARINSVQLAGVNQTLRNTLNPDEFLIVTVGQDDPRLTVTNKP